MRILLFLLLSTISLSAQNLITGEVKDEKGQAVPFANVYLKTIFDGNSTDEEGQFSFATEAQGAAIIAVSCLGYENYEQAIEITDKLVLSFVLKKGSNQLSEVVITAGAFEASDEKKNTI